MATSSKIPKIHCHVRSISMPSRSHPNTVILEEALRKLKTSDSSLKAENLSLHLTSLVKLYNGVEDFLHLQLTQQVLLKYPKCKKWVEDVLDGSIRVLDMCSTARDSMLQLKEQAQDLRSALRRRGGELNKEEKVSAYISFRKKMKKDVNKCIEELKKMECKCWSSPTLHEEDQHLEMVIRILQEVKAITISFFKSLMAFMHSSPMPKTKSWSLVSKLRPKTRSWSLVSKLRHKKQVSCEGEHEDASEVQCVDSALQCTISSKEAKGETVEKAKRGLEAMETSIEDLETGLECLLKHLIQSRVTLLNIFTN